MFFSCEFHLSVCESYLDLIHPLLLVSQGHRSFKKPSQLFESIVVVGLHPNCDVQTLHRQFVDRKFEESAKLRSALGCQNQSLVEPNIEPQVVIICSRD